MTQASVNITQQFKDGGVVPATLTGQNAVSKTYVDEQLAIRDADIAAAAGAANAAQADIDAHEASTTAHPAQNITYTGLVAGAANVKQGLDNLYTRVNNIIADGDSSAEVVDARGGYPVLGDRLNATDAQLADTTKKIGFIRNVKEFGAKGDGSTDDTAAFQMAINSLGSQGGCLYVPRGYYIITDTLVINRPIELIGEGYSWSDGTTILSIRMDGKPIDSPGIKIHSTQSVHIEGFYIINNGEELRDGISIDGYNDGAFDQMAGFITIERCHVNGFRYNFFVRHSWFIHFTDCHAMNGTFGWHIAGSPGTITTVYCDHCIASDNTLRGFYVNGAYYTTLISCASDKQDIAYKLSNAENVVMIGCASESTINTAIDIDNSTVVIDGFTSVESGTGSDNNFATMLNVSSGRISARGFSEITIPPDTTKIASVAIASSVTGSYETSGAEVLRVVTPKNGRFIRDGQIYTEGVPTAIGWKVDDIGKIVYDNNAVEQGTSPNKYIIYGYRRMTAGDGNVLGTDWLPLRALTGN